MFETRKFPSRAGRSTRRNATGDATGADPIRDTRVVPSRWEFTCWLARMCLIFAAAAFPTLGSSSVDVLAQERWKESSTSDGWSSQKLSKLFHGEGGTLADFDGDGQCDVAAGYQLFFGPDFKATAKLYDSNPYNINGYSEYFFDFDYDIDADGDPDVLIVGFPGAPSHWYRNPGKESARKGMWERFTVLEVTDNESPMFEDLTGDGKPELLCCTGGHFGYAEIPKNPTDGWIFRAVSEPGPYQRFTHGIGLGDVNDDGFRDVLSKDGWWENPGQSTSKAWIFHPVAFSGPGGAQMYAVDLDGDKISEVVTSLAAHSYGLAVYKKRPGEKEYQWDRIDIMTDKAETSATGLAISQLHAVAVADMDGDSKPDILTGKRFWAHNGNDPGENELPLLVWFKPIVVAGGLKFEPNIIDDDSGVGTQVTVEDVNGDGKLDVLSSSKRGVHVLVQVPTKDSVSGTKRKGLGNDSRSSVTSSEVARESILINDPLGGFRPAWSKSEPMNMDFETGDLRDWKGLGGAFFNQPVIGDVVAARGKGEKSGQQGEHWIGSSEIGTDVAMGTLTSRPFLLNQPYLSFLIGGGDSPQTRVELVDQATQKVLHSERGKNSDTMDRRVIDAKEWLGKSIYVRIVDESREGWGHIQFDDLRFHVSKPEN